MSAISTRSTVPDRAPERERRVGVVRVDVCLQRTRVADDHQRVAEPLELALERGLVEVLALDDERRAVAEARLRLVDRFGRELLPGRLRRQLLARQRRGEPRTSLDQARAARVDDAGLAQDVELLGGARDRLLPAPDDRAEELRDRLRPCAAASAASSRATVRIVPSTGSRTAA